MHHFVVFQHARQVSSNVGLRLLIFRNVRRSLASGSISSFAPSLALCAKMNLASLRLGWGLAPDQRREHLQPQKPINNLIMNAPINPNKALWEKGDFTRIADTMRESGEALVQRLGITKGLKVLDLGCGDGTTALPAAKVGADVLGVDIARNLVEAGNKRAAELGLNNLKFQEGDASNLEQLPDKSFDLVVSIFGAMFAPKPFEVAKEVVRVTRAGVGS
jgi:SAM-dependent methyltransferase